ncbi:hypothetical protein J2Z66_003606 [Paenibacillus eucommiae]|uniref:Uncharacterized protein n=1 Tax=Paenibacillus eucommiae TaxID=1355755 RepID=A0ABS4IWN2_9BACL|nr:hypothetical protein [Paenibacillus eucommiae]
MKNIVKRRGFQNFHLLVMKNIVNDPKVGGADGLAFAAQCSHHFTLYDCLYMRVRLLTITAFDIIMKGNSQLIAGTHRAIIISL